MNFKPLDANHPVILASAAVHEQVNTYIDDYTMECDDGTYTPTETERMLIRDAIYGLIDDDDFQRRIRAEITEREKLREAEGDCITCGCHLPNHWGGCSAQTVSEANNA